ncbi:hypothetical protein SeLEV6574_g05443 [Synchytrium endobioticum]|uniref:Vps72/YL1 C-terminal domain-containing protein n=1 Tax=Synchytrium endobioticum TaxID=286115 RepID=A0A507CU80_9FUNG|nr:hypothetical protein SeLEV6574_g05443 [Synchytrium endobioticum]
MQREKRVTAGNRLQQLLNQTTVEQEELFAEEENDQEFDQVDEPDIVDSDFDDTDEDEEPDQSADVQDEDAIARRRKRDKIAASLNQKLPSSARKKPSLPSLPPEHRKARADRVPTPKVKRPKITKIAPNVGVEVRKSNRATTVASSFMLDERIRETNQRRATKARPKRAPDLMPTQDQLIEETKHTEEINLASLHYLQQLEDERKARKPTRQKHEIEGPSVRFLSFVQNKYYITEIIDDDDDPTSSKTSPLAPEAANSGPGRPINGVGEVDNNASHASSPGPHLPSSMFTESTGSTLPPEEPTETDRIARNVIIFDDFTDDPFATLSKVPPTPFKELCPVTGLIAKYRDPTTKTPYATMEAFKIIKDIHLNQRFLWSPFLKTFIHSTDATPPSSLPPAWKESTLERGKSRALDGGRRPAYFGFRDRQKQYDKESESEPESPMVQPAAPPSIPQIRSAASLESATFRAPLPIAAARGRPPDVDRTPTPTARTRAGSSTGVPVKQDDSDVINVGDSDESADEDTDADEDKSQRRRGGRWARGKVRDRKRSGASSNNRRRSAPGPTDLDESMVVQPGEEQSRATSEDGSVVSNITPSRARRVQTPEAKERAKQRRRERAAEKKATASFQHGPLSQQPQTMVNDGMVAPNGGSIQDMPNVYYAATPPNGNMMGAPFAPHMDPPINNANMLPSISPLANFPMQMYPNDTPPPAHLPYMQQQQHMYPMNINGNEYRTEHR